jgi:hypothetical protein
MDEHHDVLPLLCRSLQHEKASLSRGHSLDKFDWQQRNESMKNGKLKTYLALKTNWSRKVS